MSHPYLYAYSKTKCKFNKILKRYGDLQTNKYDINTNKYDTNTNKYDTNTNKYDTNTIHNYNYDEYDNEYDDDEYNKSITIFISKLNNTDMDTNCLLAIITKDNPNLIHISNFGYNRKCNINKNIEHGKNTLNIMKAFFNYIEMYYPDISSIKLTDESYFNHTCVNISLYPYYILKYGKTYYEYECEYKCNLIIDIDNEHNDQKLLDIHMNNSIKSKTILINKTFIVKEFIKILDIKKTLNKPYLTLELINNFTENLIDGELVRVFLHRFELPKDSNLCKLYDEFINIIFGNNLNKLPNDLVYYYKTNSNSNDSNKTIKTNITISIEELKKRCNIILTHAIDYIHSYIHSYIDEFKKNNELNKNIYDNSEMFIRLNSIYLSTISNINRKQIKKIQNSLINYYTKVMCYNRWLVQGIHQYTIEKKDLQVKEAYDDLILTIDEYKNAIIWDSGNIEFVNYINICIDICKK